MKIKESVCSTALLVASMCVGDGIAWAEDTAPQRLELSLSGYSRWWTSYQTQSKAFEQATGMSFNGVDVRGDNEIHFTAEMDVTDNLKLGTFISLEAGGNTGRPRGFYSGLNDADDPIDMNYLYLESNWGKLSLGSQPSAAVTMQIMAPDAAGNIGTEGMLTSGLTVVDPGLGYLGAEGVGIHTTTELYTTDHNDKVIYFTPEMAGLVLAAEYTPNGEEDVRGPVNLRQTFYRDFFGAAALYTREIGDATLALSAGWIGGKLGSNFNGAYTSPDGETSNGASRRWDEWNSGMNLSYAGVTVGGSFRRSIDGRQAESRWSGDGHAWDAGVAYEGGPWRVSYVYFGSQMKNDLTLAGKDRLQVHQVSGKYNLGPGVDLLGTVGTAQFRGQDAADATRRNRGWSMMTGVEINF